MSTSFAAVFILYTSFTLAAQSPPPELLVAAATDLSAVQVPLTQAFERATGVRVRFVLGASGMLTRQIEQGAPYDVFLSANEKFVSDLAASGRLVQDSVQIYTLGRLALWSKDGSIRRLADLRSPRILHVAIANPAHAPYGAAARQALESQGLWKELQSRIVYGENVRQALQYAESGNAEAVITAWSLLFNRGGILLADNLHSPIRQSCGIVASTRHPAAARRLLEFLTGEPGRKILESNGLFPPAP